MLQRALAHLSCHLPSQCLLCHAWPAQRFCAACVAHFARPQLRCPACALPRQRPDQPCTGCHKADWPLDQTLATLRYAYPWIAPIQHFKFREHTGLAQPFAMLMRQQPALAHCLADADQIIPMPLSNARLRARGFNPSLLLARALCHSKVNTRLLARPRDTAAQSSLTRHQRWHNVQDAYQVIDAGAVARSQHILLLDDVMTTGASLCAAARTLRQAGARQVSALVLARTE